MAEYSTSYGAAYKPSPAMKRSMRRTMSSSALTPLERHGRPIPNSYVPYPHKYGSDVGPLQRSQKAGRSKKKRTMMKSKSTLGLRKSGSMKRLTPMRQSMPRKSPGPGLQPVTYVTLYNQNANSNPGAIRSLKEDYQEPKYPSDDGVAIRYRQMRELKPVLEKVKSNLDIPDYLANAYGIAPIRTKQYCEDYFNTATIPAHLPGRINNQYRYQNIADRYATPVKYAMANS